MTYFGNHIGLRNSRWQAGRIRIIGQYNEGVGPGDGSGYCVLHGRWRSVCLRCSAGRGDHRGRRSVGPGAFPAAGGGITGYMMQDARCVVDERVYNTSVFAS